MEAVVSEVFVLNQIKEVIELRETWLRYYNLPMDCQMRHKLEREWFLDYAKKQYHAEEYQLKRQHEDYEENGINLVKARMKSRWDRELQRRLGTGPLWCLVSFTGNLNVNFLEKGNKKCDNPTKTVAGKKELLISAIGSSLNEN